MFASVECVLQNTVTETLNTFYRIENILQNTFYRREHILLAVSLQNTVKETHGC
jgi:hypothetical protein